MVAGRPDEAEATQRRVVALNPNDPESLAQLGLRIAVGGHPAEAIDLLEKAIARSVVVPNWYYVTLAGALYLDGRLDAAHRTARLGAGPCCGNGQALLAITAAAVGSATRPPPPSPRRCTPGPDPGHRPACLLRAPGHHPPRLRPPCRRAGRCRADPSRRRGDRAAVLSRRHRWKFVEDTIFH
ncbi:MAG: hypothetical protein U1E14_06680 [Geminicoccaceae bacterium]